MKPTMLQEFERMLRQFGNYRYDEATDTYKKPRSKKYPPFSGAKVREAAAKAERQPDMWANFFEEAMK